jgi:hypothetical protein
MSVSHAEIDQLNAYRLRPGAKRSTRPMRRRSRPALRRSPEGTAGGCSEVAVPTATNVRVAIDYVDFIRLDGREYLAVPTPTSTISPPDLGEVVAVSRCSQSAFNERTGTDPGLPRDGDSGFLLPGTGIYAVRGWKPACRLAA